jgi:hypothetical protein
MKKVIYSVVAIALISFASCKSGWSDAEKKTYMDACVDGAKATFGEEKAKEYCSCTQEKIEAKYPKAKDLESVKQDEISELAMDCLKDMK